MTETIRPDVESTTGMGDVCSRALDSSAAVDRCLTEADALPDGAPQQISVLLRGLLAAQRGTLEMLIGFMDHLDAWPAQPDDE
jgi:hypothetical protein